MPRLDLSSIPKHKGSSYPAPFDRQAVNRIRQRLGDAGGLTQFGVNLLHLPPGAWSSQRHWHALQDEFVFVLAGEVTLVTDRGEEILRAGDCAAFPCNTPDGHHLVNHSASPVICLEVGTRIPGERVVYCDIDMLVDPKLGFTHKDGTPYPPK
jgi:uncharacterized cupin superfamily protein